MWICHSTVPFLNRTTYLPFFRHKQQDHLEFPLIINQTTLVHVSAEIYTVVYSFLHNTTTQVLPLATLELTIVREYFVLNSASPFTCQDRNSLDGAKRPEQTFNIAW